MECQSTTTPLITSFDWHIYLNYPLLLPYWSSQVKTWNFQDNEYENDNEIFEMLPNDANIISFFFDTVTFFYSW